MRITDDIRRIVAGALAEDIGAGDVTSVPIIPASTRLRGELLVKADGVISGLAVAWQTFVEVDRNTTFEQLVGEGAAVRKGDIVARVEGKGPGILIAERTALNFMQRMSGIATLTRAYVDAVKGTNAIILDTRKTVPGLRVLDKLAVTLGGGSNHRTGLYDMVLIKDNHIQAAGSITAAVQRVRGCKLQLPIEVEVTNMAQLDEAIAQGVDRIMLDNMTVEQMRTAVEHTAGRCKLEASGGVNLDTVAAIAATGVDFISVGALTHSVKALDISLDVTLER
jgi:nicotinate-nucleotide pyrophosphorylase (carboxylating)